MTQSNQHASRAAPGFGERLSEESPDTVILGDLRKPDQDPPCPPSQRARRAKGGSRVRSDLVTQPTRANTPNTWRGSTAKQRLDDPADRRAAERRFSQVQYEAPSDLAHAVRVLREGHRAKKRTCYQRLMHYWGFSRDRTYKIDWYYRAMKFNAKTAMRLNMLCLFFGMVVTEFETNKWYLDDKNRIRTRFETYILLCKGTNMLITGFLIALNVRYHVLKLALLMIRMKVSTEKRISIWQVSRSVKQLFFETLMLAVVQVPYLNGTITLPAGLSRHDPTAEYRYDIFIFLVMIGMRMKFIYRCIYLRQEIFSADAVTLSGITGTPITARLGVRNFIANRPATVTTTSFLVYLVTVAYVHNKLEGVANWWPVDRSCELVDPAVPDEEDCDLIYYSEHPVTYLNSMWIHFVSASTIGYGEYLVNTQFGRLLVCLSFLVGLLISSFVVTVLFDALAINSSEQYIIDKLKMKRMNKSLVQTASAVLQNIARQWLLHRELRMLTKEPATSQRKFTTSKILMRGKPRKGNDVGSLLERRARVQKTIQRHSVVMNLVMYKWRAAKRQYKECETLTVDKDATIMDLDRRCERMAQSLKDISDTMLNMQQKLEIVNKRVMASQGTRSSLLLQCLDGDTSASQVSQRPGDVGIDQQVAAFPIEQHRGSVTHAYKSQEFGPSGEQTYEFTENPMFTKSKSQNGDLHVSI